MATLFTPTDQEIAENRKMWAQNNEEEFLDRRTYFDLIGDDLPEHHFWKKDQNQKIVPNIMTPLQSTHHTDMTNIPRFFPNGLPKTPLKNQSWYVPLDKNGRFDWRQNIVKNQYYPVFHKKNWESTRYQRVSLMAYLPIKGNELTNYADNIFKGFRPFKVNQVPFRVRFSRMCSNVGRFSYLYLVKFGFLLLIFRKPFP
ncbi:hypothetical protein MHBO_001834, partial [Bonamia ostreae]